MAHVISRIDSSSSSKPTYALLRFGVRVCAWMVMAAVALVLAVSVVVPRLAGATPYTVLTGSMEPTMPPGTLVVVKPVDADSIGIGSVITYQLESGKPAVVTHRVVSQGVDGTGEFVFRTKGDANDAVDAGPVRPVQVRGEVWYSVPYLGKLNGLVGPRVRSIVTVALAGGLILYAVAMFAGGFRDRRDRRAR